MKLAHELYMLWLDHQEDSPEGQKLKQQLEKLGCSLIFSNDGYTLNGEFHSYAYRSDGKTRNERLVVTEGRSSR